jgi:NADH dehydrogenase
MAAARNLLASARAVGARVIFISSQTARRDAPTEYGQTKWHIEQMVLQDGGWVVRPGLVYGGAPQALFGVLVGLVSSLPLLPAFLPAPMVQPLHVDDLAHALLRCAETSDSRARIVCLGAPDPVSFTSVLRGIAAVRLGLRRGLIPVPVAAVHLVRYLAGERYSKKMSIDRIVSLCELPIMQTKDDLASLAITLRPMTAGLGRSGDNRRRRLLREGRALLRYILKSWPSSQLVRRYVRCIEATRNSTPLGLAGTLLNYPLLLALLDEPDFSRSVSGMEFDWRLKAAIVLAEATPEGGRRFLGTRDSHTPLIAAGLIARSLVCEALWRALGLAAAPFRHRMVQTGRSK